MDYILIVSIVGLILLISTILFITLRHKDSDNNSYEKSPVIREYLTNEPSLALTTVYGERPPTCNYLNWKAGQLPI